MHETFDHTADLGLRILSPSLEALFAEAGRCFSSVLLANPDSIQSVVKKQLTIDGDQNDLLLFDCLNELLFLFETERLVFAKFDARRTSQGLRVVCHGEPLDLDRHELDHAVKAITYHELKVEHTEQGWLAEVVIDL